MYFNTEGVLVLGDKTFDREKERRTIAVVDKPHEDLTARWVVIEANWINAWLAFSHYTTSCPAPGGPPCAAPVTHATPACARVVPAAPTHTGCTAAAAFVCQSLWVGLFLLCS